MSRKAVEIRAETHLLTTYVQTKPVLFCTTVGTSDTHASSPTVEKLQGRRTVTLLPTLGGDQAKAVKITMASHLAEKI